jgi:phosphopantetheinyl transferase (holo-ACP synthase)
VVGTDIVAVARIAALMRDRGAAFLERWVTAREIDSCSSSSGSAFGRRKAS